MIGPAIELEATPVANPEHRAPQTPLPPSKPSYVVKSPTPLGERPVPPVKIEPSR